MVDASLQQYLAENPQIARGLAEGTIDIRYELVRADVNGTVRIEDLWLDPASLDLTIPGRR